MKSAETGSMRQTQNTRRYDCRHVMGARVDKSRKEEAAGGRELSMGKVC